MFLSQAKWYTDILDVRLKDRRDRELLESLAFCDSHQKFAIIGYCVYAVNDVFSLLIDLKYICYKVISTILVLKN